MFVLLQHPSGLLMQLAEYCTLSHLGFFLLKDPNSSLLFRSQLHTSTWLQWQLLFFLCSLKVFYFLRNLLNELISFCLLALCPNHTWSFSLFLNVYSGRPVWTPDLSRLLSFSDPWLLSLLSVCKSLPDCMNLLLLDCSMPLLAVQPLLHLSCGEMCPQGQIHTLMCCKVLGAQSCSAISRLLKAAPFVYWDVAGIHFLPVKPSCFALEKPLCHPCPYCRLEIGCRDTRNSTVGSLHWLHFNGICCTLYSLVQPCVVYLCCRRWQLGSQNLKKYLCLKQNSTCE